MLKQTVETLPKIYGLRQLMYNKYGEEKFAIACVIVARFIGFKSQEDWRPDTILQMCNSTACSFPVTIADGEKFKQLFGLDSTDQLFNQ